MVFVIKLIERIFFKPTEKYLFETTISGIEDKIISLEEIFWYEFRDLFEDIDADNLVIWFLKDLNYLDKQKKSDGKRIPKKPTKLFFCIWVFFQNHSRFTGLQGKGEGISLTPHYHFHPLHRRLRHLPGDCCWELTSARSYQQDSNWEPLISECKSLTTKLPSLNFLETS